MTNASSLIRGSRQFQWQTPKGMDISGAAQPHRPTTTQRSRQGHRRGRLFCGRHMENMKGQEWGSREYIGCEGCPGCCQSCKPQAQLKETSMDAELGPRSTSDSIADSLHVSLPFPSSDLRWTDGPSNRVLSVVSGRSYRRPKSLRISPDDPEQIQQENGAKY